MSSLDETLKETIKNTLQNFFTSLQGDTSTLNSFLAKLSTLDDIVRKQHGMLQEETLAALHNLASIVNVVSTDLLDLHHTTENLKTTFEADIASILRDKMDKLVLNDNSKDVKSNSPLYIKPSYEWLLSNLHNPYPSKSVKQAISRKSNCSLRDIDAWFKEARKRIGWNSLRKTRFNNKQDDILLSATRILRGKIGSFSNPFSAEYSSEGVLDDGMHAEFAILVNRAESLYPDLYFDFQSKCNVKKSIDKAVTASKDSILVPYPTPQPSPNYSISPPSTPAPVQDLPTSFLKRSRSMSSSNDEDEDGTGGAKRRRLVGPPHREVISLPSPANTVDVGEDDVNNIPSRDSPAASVLQPSTSACTKRKRLLSDNGDDRTYPNQQISINTSSSYPTDNIPPMNALEPVDVNIIGSSSPAPIILPKRKRRLSEGETQRPSKRPHNALSVPRLQTVSDPLPVTWRLQDNGFDSWLQGVAGNPYHLDDTIPSLTDFHTSGDANEEALDVHSHQYSFSPQHDDPYLVEAVFQPNDQTALTGIPLAGDTFRNQELPSENGHSIQEFSQCGDLGIIPEDYFNLIPSASDYDLYESTSHHSSLATSFHNGHNSETLPLSNLNSSFLCKINTYVPEGYYGYDNAEQETKRAYVQRLREEIQRLEGELYS